MSSEVPWLNEREEHVWRRWLTLNAVLPAALHRELQESGLSLPDFDVLVMLTDSPDGAVRVSDLALQLLWERSRVSHHVSRMEKRGLVRKEGCPEDRRGSFVVVTPEGRAAIEAAAPAHVRSVRRFVFDALSPAEVEQLGDLVEKMLGRFESDPECARAREEAAEGARAEAAVLALD